MSIMKQGGVLIITIKTPPFLFDELALASVFSRQSVVEVGVGVGDNFEPAELGVNCVFDSFLLALGLSAK